MQKPPSFNGSDGAATPADVPERVTKYIFITGGVVSGVGKGVTSASIGRLLKSRGLSVVVVKLDPYINVDPGTMNPGQHGEVFVTEDGAETDLDLGHYERFIDEDLTRGSNLTSGQVYESVIQSERRGKFLGGTIQVIPHVTDEIKRRLKAVRSPRNPDVVIVEVGGTVGDIEGLPFLEALRQLRREIGLDNTLFIHVTFLLHIGATGELKTKPTQHSVAELRSIGILPDIVVCRSDHPFQRDTREKIALFCDVEERAVISLTTVDNIYRVPLTLEEADAGDLITEKLGLPRLESDLVDWRRMMNSFEQPRREIEIALVGKYVAAPDAYISVEHALLHAVARQRRRLRIRWIDSELLETRSVVEEFEGVDGLVIPGGFGPRGIEGKIAAARYARVYGLPFFGLCLGMQVALIEFARNVLGIDKANSYEFDPEVEDPVVWPMPDYYDQVNIGGTMRLGSHPCHLEPGTRAAQAYAVETVGERHRHRMEFNNVYREVMRRNGMIFSGLSPDGELVEIIELRDHPWFVGVQFHPEFKSRPFRPHPLFSGFAKACVSREAAPLEQSVVGQESRVS